MKIREKRLRLPLTRPCSVLYKLMFKLPRTLLKSLYSQSFNVPIHDLFVRNLDAANFRHC